MFQRKIPRLPIIIVVIILILFTALSAPFCVYADNGNNLKTVNIEIEGVDEEVKAIADELIVKYMDDATWKDKNEVKTENNLTKERVKRDSLKKMDIEKVKLEENISVKEVEEMIENLREDESVEYVEPNYVMGIQSVSVNDTQYSSQWSLHLMNIGEIWEYSMGGEGVIIAVLDTGIDYSHPDKPKNIVQGYDFINDDSDPQDDHGHGTFVAGVIAANTDNTIGIAGVCSDCSIMPIKVMDEFGMGTYAHVANGIVWAADNGADIINLSVGGYAYSQALLDAVRYAQEKGALIIAAGGNQGVSSPLYPASYTNVIGVSATDKNDQRWSRSNFGDYIDISAPGVDVYGLNLNSNYRSQTGSSVAAPHVAGIAGLLLSQEQDLNTSRLTQKLYNRTVDLGDTGRDDYFGEGRVGFSKSEEQGIDIGDPEPDDNKNEINNDNSNGENETTPPDFSGNQNDVGDESHNDQNDFYFHNIKIKDIKIEKLPGAGTNGIFSQDAEEDINQSQTDNRQDNDGNKTIFHTIKNELIAESYSFKPSTGTPAEHSGEIHENVNHENNSNNKDNTNENVGQNGFSFLHDNEVIDNKAIQINSDSEDTVSIVVQIQNQGQTEEENILVRVFADNNQLGSHKTIAHLQSGEIQNMQFLWKPKVFLNKSEKITIRAEVDRIQGEEYIKDNTKTSDFTLRNDDGVIKILPVSPGIDPIGDKEDNCNYNNVNSDDTCDKGIPPPSSVNNKQNSVNDNEACQKNNYSLHNIKIIDIKIEGLPGAGTRRIFPQYSKENINQNKDSDNYKSGSCETSFHKITKLEISEPITGTSLTKHEGQIKENINQNKDSDNYKSGSCETSFHVIKELEGAKPDAHFNQTKKTVSRNENSDDEYNGDKNVIQYPSFLHDNEVIDNKAIQINSDSEDTVSIVVQIQNQGQTEEENILVRVFADNNQLGNAQTIHFLESGATQSIQFTWKPEIAWNEGKKLILKAEVEKLPNETKIEDNTLTKSLSIKNENGLITIQYDIDPPVHQYLTEQGVYYLHNVNLEAYKEIKDYITQLRTGAEREDTIDTSGYNDPDNNTSWRALRHFYRPTDKKGYFDGGAFNVSTNLALNAPDVPDDTRYPNSYEWAKDREKGNHYSFQDAIDEYNKGNTSKAYEILGYVIHLIEDASLPEHTQLESHYDGPYWPNFGLGGNEIGSGYEQYVRDQFDYFTELSPQNIFNKLLHNETCILNPDEDPRVCFTSKNTNEVFSYYDEMISEFTNLEQYFDSMASLSYYRNRFKGDLSKEKGQRGQIETMFPSLDWDSENQEWTIDRIGNWSGANSVDVDDEWWETIHFDSNINEYAEWYYIENSYRDWNSFAVRPAKYKADWYSYALGEMKKPREQRFKVPYSGTYVENNQQNGKILAEVFAEDLIPLAVQHAAGVMDLFWRETHPEWVDETPKLPDLTFRLENDNDFSFTYEEKLFGAYYNYIIKAKVKNIGKAASTGGQVCLEVNGRCRGTTSIENLGVDEVTEVKLEFRDSGLFPDGHVGTLRIYSVPKEANTNNNTEEITTDYLAEAGGIDLTEAQLSGIKIDPSSNQIRFVIKGDPAVEGDQVINLSDARNEQTKIFLQALAVPNYKHYISLDIIPDANGIKGYRGSARVPEPFEQTDIADAFLKADVAMKFDLFSANTIFDSFTYWTNLVKSSPHWNELSSKGFDRYPDWTIAATIIPGEIKATQTGNDFFLEDVKLDIDAGWWIREPTLSLSGYNLSAGAREDLEAKLALFKQTFEQAIKNRALNITIPEMNNGNDPRFVKLRSIYAAIAAAQWYKEQAKLNPELPYAHLVDKEDLSDFGIDHTFDRDYWDGQAWQDLGTTPCTMFQGQANCWYRGGLSLEESDPEITGKLTSEQNSILETAIQNFDTVQSNGEAYMYGGTVSASAPDVEMGSIITGEEKYLMGSPISFDVQLFNAGPIDAENVQFKVYDEVLSDGGQRTTHPIAERIINSITAWEGATESFNWTLPEITGTHSIYAIADPQDTIQEMSEMNNQSGIVIEVLDPHPVISLISPTAGSVKHPGNIVFEASAIDPMNGDITDESAYSWNSNIDHNLGTGLQITKTLSEGNHQITLTVDGPHGVSSDKIFDLFVRPLGMPLPKIKYPIDGNHLSKELTYHFTGDVADNEDGVLTGSSLKWHSSRDGDLGEGEEIDAQLTEGSHTISLKATDSDGNESEAKITVTSETGTPELTVTAPTDGQIITEGEETGFTGLAIDGQEGDISNRIIWSSNIDGLLDQTDEFDQILSEGEHQITVMIVDSDGLKDTEEMTITIQNTHPVAEITAPTSPHQVNFGEEITFSGLAEDEQDGVTPEENLTWSSSRDGYMGMNANLTIDSLSPGWHTVTLTATDSKGLTGTTTIRVNIHVDAPAVNILQPASGQSFTAGRTVILEGSATDVQDGDLSANLTWTSDRDGSLGTGSQLNLNSLSVGAHTITATTTDNDGWQGSAQTTMTVSPKQAPQASILFPLKGSNFEQGENIYFYGTASDTEDGNLTSADLAWTSNVDGQIGTGFNFSKNNLSVGNHIITLTATDSDNMNSKSTVSIVVTPLAPIMLISQPADKTVIKTGESITLAGNGADSLLWSSNLDGELGSGSSLTVTLSTGSHQITLTGTDSYGSIGSADITVTVVDENTLSINEFADGETAKALDFESGQNYTLNLSLAKDAIVDNAQVSIHAQRGMDLEMDILSVQTEESKIQLGDEIEDENIERQEEGIEIINEIPQPSSTSAEQGEPIDSEEFMGIMATNYQVLGHYMTNVWSSNNPPQKNPPKFIMGETVASYIKLGNLHEPGQVKWIFTEPDNGITYEGISDIPTGYTTWAIVRGWENGLFSIGNWKVDIYLKANSSADWTYYYTENFSIHEYPSVPPVVNVGVRYYGADLWEDTEIYENQIPELYVLCDDRCSLSGLDNGRVVSRGFYWNDGTGWKNDVQSAWMRCNGNNGLTTRRPGTNDWYWDNTHVKLDQYPESTTVQYYATITDFDGNTTQTPTQSFTVLDDDTEGPEIKDIEITEDTGADMDGMIDETEPFKFDWKAEDKSGIGELTFHIDGQPVEHQYTGNQYNASGLSPLPYGEHGYTIMATDGDNSPESTTLNSTFEIARRPFLVSPFLDAGKDDNIDWQIVGEMTEDQITGNFSDSINSYLQNNIAGADGKVTVPLHFHADSGNVMKVSDLNLSYRILDTSPPVIGEVIVSPEFPYSGSNIDIQVTATDNVAIETVTATLDGNTIALTLDGDYFTGNMTAPNAGEYELEVRVTDITGLETISAIPLTVQFNGAELSIKEVVFNPASPLLSGQKVSVTITLENTGNQEAVSAKVLLSHATTEILTADIPAQDTKEINTSFVLPDPEEYTFQAEIDPNDLIAEDDETNNIYNYLYKTTDGTAPVFEEVNVPEKVGAGQSFALTAKVTDNVSVSSVLVHWNGEDVSLPINQDEFYTGTLTAPDALGPSTLIITAIDSTGLSSTIQKVVQIIDSKPNPYISDEDIIKPANIMALETPEFQINIHNNGGSDVTAPVQIKLDGSEVDIQDHLLKTGEINSVLWNGWEATSGTHTIEVNIDPENVITETDETDNSASLIDFVVPYTLPPQLSNLNVTEDVTDNELFEIAINVLGDQEIQEVAININSSTHPMTSSDGKTYRYSDQLPIGNYPFEIMATNISSLSARQPGSLTVYPNLADLTVDIPTITPVNLTNQDVAEFTITVRNDGFVGVTDIPVNIRLNDSHFAIENVTLPAKSEVTLPVFNWNPVPGSHTLKAFIDPNEDIPEINETNNTSSIFFKVGNVIPPAISDVTLKEILYTGESFTVSGVITDQVSFSSSVKINGSSEVMTLDEPSGKYNAVLAAPFASGDYHLTITAVNADGLSSVWERNITILDSRPDLSIRAADVMITPRNLIENETETITTVIRNFGGTDTPDVSVLLRVNGNVIKTQTVSVPKGGNATLVWQWVPEFGTQDISIEADSDHQFTESDETNNTYSVSLYIKDITPPEVPQPIASVRVQAIEWTEERNWSVTWPEVEENNLKNYQYRIDGGLWIDIGLKREVSISFDTAGEHMICIKAEDQAGNFSPTACTSVLLDFEAPGAPVLRGGNKGRWSSSSIHRLSWNTPLDDGSGASDYLIKINDQTSSIGNQNYYQKEWDDGVYTVQVAAIDQLDHQSAWSNEIVLSVDSTPPPVIDNLTSSTHPDQDGWYENGNPVFDWSPPKDLSGVQGYYYYIDRQPDTDPDSRYFWTSETELSVLEDETLDSGKWYLHINAVDNAGNKATKTAHYAFGVDFDAPQTTVAYVNGNTVILDAYDPHSGIKNTYYSLIRLGDIQTLSSDPNYSGLNWKKGDIFSLPEFGVYTVFFYSIDNLGHEEEVRYEDVENISPDEATFSPSFSGGGYRSETAYYKHLDYKKENTDDEDTTTDDTDGESDEITSEYMRYLERLYSYYKIRKAIACQVGREKDARCFWARVELVFAKQILGKTDIPDVLTELDIKRLRIKLVIFKRRFQMYCEKAETPAAYCQALNGLIWKGEYLKSRTQ